MTRAARWLRARPLFTELLICAIIYGVGVITGYYIAT